MPPFAVEGLEAVTEHGFAQDHPVGELLGCDAPCRRTLMVVTIIFAGVRIATEIRMAFRTEPVEGSAHVDVLACNRINESQIHG